MCVWVVTHRLLSVNPSVVRVVRACAVVRVRVTHIRACVLVSKVKDDLMYECVMAKFSQHDNIRRTLLNTEDALLVEHTSNGAHPLLDCLPPTKPALI